MNSFILGSAIGCLVVKVVRSAGVLIGLMLIIWTVGNSDPMQAVMLVTSLLLLIGMQTALTVLLWCRCRTLTVIAFRFVTMLGLLKGRMKM